MSMDGLDGGTCSDYGLEVVDMCTRRKVVHFNWREVALGYYVQLLH